MDTIYSTYAIHHIAFDSRTSVGIITHIVVEITRAAKLDVDELIVSDIRMPGLAINKRENFSITKREEELCQRKTSR